MATTQMDVVIVGAGPAGLAAALYGARDRYKTIALDKLAPGGQINLTERIENFPGIARISGPDLVGQLSEQAQAFGAEIVPGVEVTGLQRQDDGRVLVNTDSGEYLTRVVILAPGSDYRRLDVPGETKFREAGAGVSYCGTCDAPFFKDKTVVAVGGGNTAVEDTLHLARFVKKVTIIHRRDEFRATRVLVEELLKAAQERPDNIEVRYDTVLATINGGDSVTSATVRNVKTDATEDLPCDGVFIFVGMTPNTEFLRGSVELDENNYIACDPTYLRTNMPGVFVAGDCRAHAAMQLATAIGDGVACAMYMKEYLRDPQWWTQ